MTSLRHLKWLGGGALIVCVMAVLLPTISIWGKDVGTQEPVKALGPLIARGYTDVRAESALVAGDPAGGDIVTELKVRAGEYVRKGQILAILSNSPAAALEVAKIEANIEKARSQEQSMLSGFRRSEVDLQEGAVRLAETNYRLKELELSRTTLAPDEKELRVRLLLQRIEREKAKLIVNRQRLDADLGGLQTELQILEGRLADAEYARDQALVRAPIDGLVTEILAHTGERVFPKGVVRIVDLERMRIYADVDEVHLSQLKKDGRVEFTFRGSQSMYEGRITRLPGTVKRTKRSEADLGESNARLAEIEIEPLDQTSIVKLLGQETRVTFR